MAVLLAKTLTHLGALAERNKSVLDNVAGQHRITVPTRGVFVREVLPLASPVGLCFPSLPASFAREVHMAEGLPANNDGIALSDGGVRAQLFGLGTLRAIVAAREQSVGSKISLLIGVPAAHSPE